MTEKRSWQETMPLASSHGDAEPKLPILWGKGSSNISKHSCNWWNIKRHQWLGECPVGRLNQPNLKNIHLLSHAFKQHLFKNKLYIQISPQNVSSIVSYYKFKASWFLFFCWWGFVLMVLFPQRRVQFPKVSKGQQWEIVKKVIYKKSSLDSGSAMCFTL